jgi:hypothetical protein
MSDVIIGDLVFHIEWDNEASFDTWHGTLTDSTETPTEGTINASCGVPGGSDNNTINCVQFKAHPTNGKGYCGFYSNFPDSLNPKLETLPNSLVVELSSTYLEDQGYFEDNE